MFWLIFSAVLSGLFTAFITFIIREDTPFSGSTFGNLVISILWGVVYGFVVYYMVTWLGVHVSTIIGLVIVWFVAEGLGINA